MKKRTIFILTLASLSLCSVSCNTIAGVGKDLTTVGNTVTNTVNRTNTAISPNYVQPQPQQQSTVYPR